MTRLDARVFADLAARQLDLDAARTRRFPALLGRKYTRVSASPFAFLRGSCPLFHEMLDAWPHLREDGPDGTGWVAGDLHLENFGAYRPDAGSAARAKSRRAVFDLNDFDEACVRAWRVDLLRLAV